jgi:hypothetical protein
MEVQMHQTIYTSFPVRASKRGGRLQELPAEKRLLLALDQIKGPNHATIASAARAVGLSASYIWTGLHASDAEIAAMADGRITLASLHNKTKKQQPIPDPWQLTDLELELFIGRAGIGRVWGIVEKMTAPMQLEAAE